MTDLATLLPPLTKEEFAALKADIKANGVRDPICVDEDGVILDGRNRYAIDPNCPRRVISGLSEGEKEAFVFRSNFVRRNLSGPQKKEALKKMKATAFKLREEDHRKWTQTKIAVALGVDQSTVSNWSSIPNMNGHNRYKKKKRKLDARVKITPEGKEEIYRRVKAGESQEQVAADFGITQAQVSRIVTAEKKKREQKRKRAEAARKVKGNCGIFDGDFRKAEVPENSVQLIFTDPPYDEDSIGLYGALAVFSAKVLQPGGWLLTYAGHAHLDRVFAQLSGKGLTYAWTFAILHSGGDLRFRKFKLHNGWKPIIGYFKPPLNASWDWFKDVVSGGKEKDDHEWQQAIDEAAHFINQLSNPRGMICDPMCGSGTTLLAAKELKRRWLGFDINKGTARKARGKLA